MYGTSQALELCICAATVCACSYQLKQHKAMTNSALLKYLTFISHLVYTTRENDWTTHGVLV